MKNFKEWGEVTSLYYREYIVGAIAGFVIGLVIGGLLF